MELLLRLILCNTRSLSFPNEFALPDLLFHPLWDSKINSNIRYANENHLNLIHNTIKVTSLLDPSICMRREPPKDAVGGISLRG